MLLRLTYLDGRRLRTVSVRAPAGTPWAAVARGLGLPSTPLAAEYAGTRVLLTPDRPLGSPPLVQGVVILPYRAEKTGGTFAPVSLHVASGPDSGGSCALRAGHRVTVGRGSWCDLVVDDPGLSRQHLSVLTTRDGIVVEDLSSTNGTSLAGSRITGPTGWLPGVPLRAGATTFLLARDVENLSRGSPDGAGRIVVSPRGHTPPPVEPVALSLPQLSAPSAPVPPAVLGWLLPLVVSVLLAVILAMPALMLFGLMAPAMSLGAYAGERRRFRRESALATRTHRTAVAAVRAAAREAVDAEVRRREERVPDLARLIREATGRGELLWSRTSAELLCRLGLGPRRTAVTVDGTAEPADAAPVELDLSDGIALVGPPDVTRAAARSVLLQVAVLHAPSELRVTVAQAGETAEAPAGCGPWDWVAWLPHAEVSAPGRSGRVLVLHDLADKPDTIAGEALPRVTTATPEPGDDGPPAIPVYLCPSPAQAPDVGTSVRLGDGTAELRTGSGTCTATPDLVSAHRATAVARVLAALRDGREDPGSGGVPESVSLSALTPVPLEAEAIALRWQKQPRTTRFVLGRGPDGDVWLDLAEDGPHALVAGTTGAGKSELLRTLVTSLALGNRPDELVLVLVDYKGGSAFADAAALPHVVGMVTDLDPHLADRALTSLTAELKRRERILAEAGVPDLPAYQDLPGRDRLPRLVLVIDEFRALAEELPGFLDGLVRIAALGRSLGVHLVLATQRPGGVVSADVRANVNLRIALRVRDASDSYDVIDSPAAAALPEGRPGRALIRTGASPPREVQVASSSTDQASTGRLGGLSIVPVTDPWGPAEHPVPEAGPREESPASTLAAAVAATVTAAERVGAVAPPTPWLPALPDLVPVTALPEPDGGSSPDHTPGEGERGGERTAYAVPLLLTDLPARQAQPSHHWHPLEHGHLGVVGAGRTGRTTLVRTILGGLLSRSPEDVHCYVFDLAGGIGPVADAPHVGAVLGAADVVLGCRVVDHLVRLVATRQRDLAAAGRTTLVEQRASGERPWPLVVLVIDGWPRFAELFGEADRGRPLDQVLQLLREGLGAGVVAVVTGDRSMLGGRIGSLLPELWSLRLTDPSDLLMAGLTRSQVPVSMPPGRVVRLRDGVVGQVAVVGAAGDGAAQVSALTSLVRESAGTAPLTPPARFVRLPRTVALRDLPRPAGGLLLGVGGDGAEPVTLPCDPGAATVAGVLGPPGSGRSTTLRTLATTARDRGWTVLEVTDGHLRDAADLDSALRGSAGDVLVTVDGLDRFAQTPVEDVLLSWVEEPFDGTAARALVVAGAPGDFGGFRGLGARVQRERTGLVLQAATPADGSGLGVAVPTGDEPVPGRGVLVVRGTCLAVQVARPEGRPG